MFWVQRQKRNKSAKVQRALRLILEKHRRGQACSNYPLAMVIPNARIDDIRDIEEPLSHPLLAQEARVVVDALVDVDVSDDRRRGTPLKKATHEGTSLVQESDNVAVTDLPAR